MSLSYRPANDAKTPAHRECLRAWSIEPQRALNIWWRKHGRTLRTDRKFQNRRNVLRQLGVKIKA